MWWFLGHGMRCNCVARFCVTSGYINERVVEMAPSPVVVGGACSVIALARD